MPTLWVSGIVAARNKEPYIMLMREEQTMAQMTVAEARQFANDIMLMASRTEADAMILKFFDDQQFPEGAGAAVMQQFREYRAKLDDSDRRI